MNPADDNDEQVYDYKDSAYVQNLAELCNTVLNDLRWRVPKSPSDSINAESLRLFSSEYGDNTDTLWAFQQLFDREPTDSSKRSDDRSMQTVDMGRCMHLYARTFHRKGPWFTIDDLFLRYYIKKKQKQNQVDSQHDCCVNNNQSQKAIFGDSYNYCLHDSIELFQYNLRLIPHRPIH